MSVAMRFVLGLLVLAAVAVGVWFFLLRPEAGRVDLGSLGTVTLERDASVELPHRIDHPVSANGCPAYTVDAPVAPRATVTEQDTTFIVDDDPMLAILLVCMGTVDEIGHVGETVGAVPAEDVGATRFATPVWVQSPFGKALHVQSRFETTGTMLSEWFVERDGYVYAVGHLHPDDDMTVIPTIEAMLTTWQWS